MAIADTVDLIQTLIRNAGLGTTVPAFAAYPLKADTADLPLILTLPSEGTFHHKGVGGALKRQDRTYRVIVFVEPLGQSVFPTRAIAAATLLQSLIDLFLMPSSVALADPPTYQVTIEEGAGNPHSDTGIVPSLEIGGAAHHGFEIRLRVRELW